MIDIREMIAINPRQTKTVLNNVNRELSKNGYLKYANRPRRTIFNITEVVSTIRRESVQSRLRRIGLDIAKTKVKDIA